MLNLKAEIQYQKRLFTSRLNAEQLKDAGVNVCVCVCVQALETCTEYGSLRHISSSLSHIVMNFI